MDNKQIEGLICPACSTPISEEDLRKKLYCPKCKKNLKQKKYLAFLEFLMMQGIVANLDFFDKKLYGDEIKKSPEIDELKDETDPNEYEDKKLKFEQYEDDMELKVEPEEEEDDLETNVWSAIDEDWMEFNRKQIEKDLKKDS
ncbi:MAG: hypothetical protein GXO91_05630 [FCB group bacterium]|nr:hypothetical protein [FCB group bacterium]